MNHTKITADRLLRKAIVYVRQSSPNQMLHHQESQRRQYGLVDRARELGFQQVTVIDEDLGRTGSGFVERPGFQRLVADVCSGEVSAVFCIEASRLARNGRDWHHLIELCGMVGAVVVDFDGIYDPNIVNDRLLLGLKGTMSEFELSLLRQRSEEAIRQKARRGELQFLLPVGFSWTSGGKIEKDPDERVQQAIEMVFRKLTELGSVRRVLLWFAEEKSLFTGVPSRSWGAEDDLEATSLFEHSCDPNQPHLCRRICFRQDRNTNSHRERTCTEDRWSSQAATRMDGLDSRPSPRLHFMAGV